MFFSSDKDNLPRIGELICIRGSTHHERPYRVTSRSMDNGGQVYVDLIDIATGQQMPRCKVEPFSFWPSQGDTVLIIMGPYLDWLALSIFPHRKGCSRLALQQLHFVACQRTQRTTTDLCQKHIVSQIEGHGVDQMAALTNEDGRDFKCPMKVLAVLHKKDRRSDSQFDQLERAKQMNLLEEAA
ncbi:hypothetical protein Lepto7375DRAFT_7437 [Leptolyngbya sp. PCC 7375]|nr:hypothetical protein Lepto7375DRAFT_7437 [Leptolyngbya sp. PCC 7375]